MEMNDSENRDFIDFSSSSPNKRLKLQIESEIVSTKGKEKIVDENEEEVIMDKICGICINEEGKAIRGLIDSCDHYFCFVCIMEWAKVESRCPMCKQRFSTIRRPPKDGVFINERLVNVPIRDQVWHPFGNVTSGPSDPYAKVSCIECHSSLDESLLLLCDLCDSAAHTYCVGLESIPEGDWFCHDCTVSKDDHSNSHLDNDCQDQDSRVSDTTQMISSSVSILEIVQESNPMQFNRPLGRTSLPHCPLPPPSTIVDDRTTGTRVNNPTGRTLRRCRDVQAHIRSLRENWNALRSGSMCFSSDVADSGSKNKKSSSGEVIHDKKSEPRNTTDGTPTGESSKEKGYDTDRAWKMLDIAKSVKHARDSKSSTHQASNHLRIKKNAPIETNVSFTNSPASKNKSLPHKNNWGFTSENNGSQFIGIAHGKHTSQMTETENLSSSRDAIGKSFKGKKRDLTTAHSSGFCDFSPRQVHTSLPINVCHENVKNITLQFNHGSVINERDRLDASVPCSAPLVRRSGCKSESSKGKDGLDNNYDCKSESSKEKSRLGKSSANIVTKNDGGAKSEVQSLVKLNLKLLSRKKQLGVDGFKEIARLSTHTILAACGLEHTKSNVRSFSKSICRHVDETQQQLRMSKLMPTSCRECFYAFVKDVVSSILTEKLTCGHSNSITLSSS